MTHGPDYHLLWRVATAMALVAVGFTVLWAANQSERPDIAVVGSATLALAVGVLYG